MIPIDYGRILVDGSHLIRGGRVTEGWFIEISLHRFPLRKGDGYWSRTIEYLSVKDLINKGPTKSKARISFSPSLNTIYLVDQ